MKKSNLFPFDAVILAIVITASISLPLSILFEFNKSYIFYFQLYPHMILFPLFCFGIIGINLYQSFMTIKRQKKNTRSKVFIVAISLVISLFFYHIEITSNNIMLFELGNKAIANVNVSQETIEQIYKIPKDIIDPSEIINQNSINISKSKLENSIVIFINDQYKFNIEQKTAYYELMKSVLSYSAWEDRNNEFSLSRNFYAISFFIMVFASLINWMLLFTYSYRDTINTTRYINGLVISSLLFFTWFPLRLYYNLITKNLLFGSEEAIGQLDIFAFLIYPLYFSFLCWKFFQFRKDRFVVSLIAITVVLLTLVGRFKPEWVSLIFGLNSNPFSWIFILVIAIVYFFYLLKTTKRNT